MKDIFINKNITLSSNPVVTITCRALEPLLALTLPSICIKNTFSFLLKIYLWSGFDIMKTTNLIYMNPPYKHEKFAEVIFTYVVYV